MKERFKKDYSISGMTKWLKANDFRYKKAHGVPAKANEVEQEKFIQQYKEIKAKVASSKGSETIYFVDSTHPEHQTRLSYGWIRKGVRHELPRTAKQKRLHIIGAINLKGHKIVHHMPDKINAESIESFLKKLRRETQGEGKIHLIWDNAGYHTAKTMKAFSNTLNIELHYLPPYSPNLNPIERLWKIMHEQVTYNKYYEKFSQFTEGILNFFKNIDKMKPIIQARINDNFQKIAFP